MYRPFTLFVALRYVRAKNKQSFISVISFISIACFAIGVTTLITVLSVMNGFDEQIRDRVFSMAPQVTVSTYENILPDWKTLQHKIRTEKHVIATAPYITGQGMLVANGQTHAAIISGVLPTDEAQISEIENKMDRGSLTDLTPGSFGVLLGSELAASLGVSVGDKVTLLTPTAAVTPFGVIPRYKPLTVKGIFTMGQGFGFDTNYAYIHLSDAQKLYQYPGTAATGIRLKVDDLYAAPSIAHQVAMKLPINYSTSDWTQQFGAFFQAIALEKTMMFFILLLIIVVAAFSLLSTLYMIVTDKTADVAIMRTYGATPRTILGVFIIQGFVVGLIGTIFGVIFGLLLAYNVTALADSIQNLFHIKLMSSSVNYVDFLPSKIEWEDIVKVSLVAVLISLVATLLPAWRAARIQPVEALSYE